MPIIVAGALASSSGLGQSARLCHDALKAAGLPVFGIDLTTELMQQADLPAFPFTDGRSLVGPATLILHVNAHLVPLAMLRLGRRLTRQKWIVGYWAWELPSTPSEWRYGVPFVHDIWVPSQFTALAVAPIGNGRSVRVLAHPVALAKPTIKPRPVQGDRPFTVLTVFNAASSFARKNPVAAVRAFGSAFACDPTVRLVIKASNLDTYPPGADELRSLALADTRIDLIDRILSSAELDELYAGADVCISLHRSEGFGLILAEAMIRGLPVVATGWSGNVDFVTSQTGISIPYLLIPATDPQFTYHFQDMVWADPDVGLAAEALKQLRGDPELRSRLGAAAAKAGALAWTAKSYGETVLRHLGLSATT